MPCHRQYGQNPGRGLLDRAPRVDISEWPTIRQHGLHHPSASAVSVLVYSVQTYMAKGIEIRDDLIGTGDEAAPGKTVVVNVRMFLHQGEEVFVYPEPRVRIDLKGRKCIPGLRKGIIGMRVGGIRTITISPHLAFGAEGVAGKIPPNALLRCEVQLLDVRELGVRKPEDFPPGKHLFVFRPGEAARSLPRWQFGADDTGRCGVHVTFPIPGLTWRHAVVKDVAWQIDRTAASAFFEEVLTLPERFPGECLSHDALWSDSTEAANGITRDQETETLCISISVSERGQRLVSYALRETSLALKALKLYRAIQLQIELAFGPGAKRETTSPGE